MRTRTLYMAAAIALLFVCFDVSTSLFFYRRDSHKDFERIKELTVSFTREQAKAEELTARVAELEEQLEQCNVALLKSKYKPTKKLDPCKL
jgi:hypothetical protein